MFKLFIHLRLYECTIVNILNSDDDFGRLVGQASTFNSTYSTLIYPECTVFINVGENP